MILINLTPPPFCKTGSELISKISNFPDLFVIAIFGLSHSTTLINLSLVFKLKICFPFLYEDIKLNVSTTNPFPNDDANIQLVFLSATIEPTIFSLVPALIK